MMKRIFIFLFVTIALEANIPAQTSKFSHQDTLRGSITPERSWWDLIYYHLNISVNPDDSTIKGTNTIYYKVLTTASLMQIDLQFPMILTKAVQNGKSVNIIKDGYAHFIQLTDKQVPGAVNSWRKTKNFSKTSMGWRYYMEKR
jgi:hypothetical protein